MPREEKILEGIEFARSINNRAYAPYSNFTVSAALYLPDHDIFVPGVNVENLSYGATICAERSAIASAISQYGGQLGGRSESTDQNGVQDIRMHEEQKIHFGFIVVYTRSSNLIPPCGICRQFIAEFVDSTFPIILANERGMRENSSLARLLPSPFENF